MGRVLKKKVKCICCGGTGVKTGISSKIIIYKCVDCSKRFQLEMCKNTDEDD